MSDSLQVTPVRSSTPHCSQLTMKFHSAHTYCGDSELIFWDKYALKLKAGNEDWTVLRKSWAALGMVEWERGIMGNVTTSDFLTTKCCLSRYGEERVPSVPRLCMKGYSSTSTTRTKDDEVVNKETKGSTFHHQRKSQLSKLRTSCERESHLQMSFDCTGRLTLHFDVFLVWWWIT